MAGEYAKTTSVAVEKSRAEIESVLERYGATAFAYGWDASRAVIQFMAEGRQIRFILPLPDRSAREFTHQTAKGRTHLARTPSAAQSAYEQACRQRWRALLLAIKAKLESVACGIATFEDEFLAYVVLPDGQTAGDFLRPQLERAYAAAEMPSLLPGAA